VAQKFDGSKRRSYPGRPKIDPEIEQLIVEMARENSGWGYDRIAGALANLGHNVSDQTVGNVLRRHWIAPAPKGTQTTAWRDFIVAHMAVLAGMDFFTAEVLTWRGPATYYVLFVIQLETRRVTLAGITRHPTEEWMQQVARNLTDADAGALRGAGLCRHLNHNLKSRGKCKRLLYSGSICRIVRPICKVMLMLDDCALVNIDGIWVLMWRAREYMRLLNARSREDAEQQIAEMLFLRNLSAII
jgi:hypothetical protein